MTWLIIVMLIALVPMAIGVEADGGLYPWLVVTILLIKVVALIAGVGGALWLLWHEQHVWFAIGYLLAGSVIRPKNENM